MLFDSSTTSILRVKIDKKSENKQKCTHRVFVLTVRVKRKERVWLKEEQKETKKNESKYNRKENGEKEEEEEKQEGKRIKKQKIRKVTHVDGNNLSIKISQRYQHNFFLSLNLVKKSV